MMIIKHKGHVDLKTFPVRRGHCDGEAHERTLRSTKSVQQSGSRIPPHSVHSFIHQISFHLSLLIATTWQQLDCGFVVIFTTRNDTLCTNNPSGDCRNKPRAQKKNTCELFFKKIFLSHRERALLMDRVMIVMRIEPIIPRTMRLRAKAKSRKNSWIIFISR